MTIFSRILTPALLLFVLVLGGCGTPPASLAPGETREIADRRAIAELTTGIMALGADIDPEEAARTARISIEYSRQLAVEYNVTDPPLIHNTKVNMGLRPRGLCYHWADDLEARLRQENFQTLDLHRAIANSTNIRIEHSTTIVGRRGDTMEQGMIVDPWRYGGTLFFSPVLEDDKYIWIPRAQVFAEKRRRLQAKGLTPPQG